MRKNSEVSFFLLMNAKSETNCLKNIEVLTLLGRTAGIEQPAQACQDKAACEEQKGEDNQ
jgi:hypothetical protein